MKSFNKFPQNSEYIISIDNPNSEYFDDALSINDDILTVYISNVCTWLEELSLWVAKYNTGVGTIPMSITLTPVEVIPWVK